MFYIRYKGTKLWNRLPATLKLSSSVPVFKHNIKKYLSSQKNFSDFSMYSHLAVTEIVYCCQRSH